jgi:hypothetical protein
VYLNAAILAAVVASGLFLWSPSLRKSASWRAMTTPLASIIGSGFLVLGPILDVSYGKFAPLVMLALCLGAYMFGSAIRFNMAGIGDEIAPRPALETRLETLASAALGFAYMISVAYYLNLFGAFAVSLTADHGPTSAKLLTSAIFVVILFVGWTRGFKTLESMEYFSVSLKLAIIVGLLVGLAAYFLGKAGSDGLVFNLPAVTGWGSVTLAFGLLVTVQGFETSRYLGEEYDTATRIRSMRWSQYVSTAIYMIFILLLAYVFQNDSLTLSETAIVDMMQVVAPILPVLLVAAALAAQFSAAVADTSGSGGLINELSRQRLSHRQAYALLVAIGLGLTWIASVFEIIGYASRAFAAYYTLQAVIAALAAHRRQGVSVRSLGFGALAVLGLAIVLFGQPVEA